MSDALSGGRRFRMLAVVDDLTRECLGSTVDTSLSGLRLGRELDCIAELRGCRLATIVSDNGTELTSHAILRRQEEKSVLWHCIAPPPAFHQLRWRNLSRLRPASRGRTGSSKASMAASGTSA